jgi:hypothetical protein
MLPVGVTGREFFVGVFDLEVFNVGIYIVGAFN